MTTLTLPAPAAPTRTPAARAGLPAPRILAGAILELAALGLIGPWVLITLAILSGIGIGTAAIGVGLVLLLGVVYALFALSWIETARVEGLYRYGLPPRRARRSGRPGFTGFLKTVGLQAIDPSMWRAIANGIVAIILGVIVLGLFRVAAAGVSLAFAPVWAPAATEVGLGDTGIVVPSAWTVPVGILVVLLAAAAIAGLGLLDGVLSRAILVPSKEAQLAEAARASSAQRDGAVRAADVERTRIERDLHDGVQPRLVSVGMTLGLAQQKIDDDPAAAKLLLAEAHASTKAAITELRQLARGIHTSVLDDRGLDAALSALAARSHTPVALDVRMTGRCSREAETAVYFVVAEALTNAAKHSRAAQCRVLVRERDGGELWVRIEDDGIGGAVATPGGGLDGVENRVLGARGTFRLDSPVGGPTTVEASIPCAS